MTDKLRLQKTWDQFLDDPQRHGRNTTLRLCYLRLDLGCVEYLTEQWNTYTNDKNRAWFLNRIEINNCYFRDEVTVSKFLHFLKAVGKELELIQIAQGALYTLMFEETLAQLLEGLKHISSIQTLILSQVQLGDPKVASALQRLVAGPRCRNRNLVLQSCQFNAQSTKALASSVRWCSGFQSLKFQKCTMTDNQQKQLVDSIVSSRSRGTLRALEMDHISGLSSSESLSQFTRLLKQLRRLQRFQLRNCNKSLFFGIDDPDEDEQFADFCEALGTAPSLQHLDLSQCHLSQDATIALLQHVGTNERGLLQTLKMMQQEPLQTEMAIQGILQMPRLSTLHLFMADTVVSQGTLQAFEKNTRLVCVDLGNCRWNKRVAPLVERNQHLQRAQALSSSILVPRQHTFKKTSHHHRNQQHHAVVALCVGRLKACPHALFLFLTTAALYPWVPPSSSRNHRRRQSLVASPAA